jgi:hypothetical protein
MLRERLQKFAKENSIPGGYRKTGEFLDTQDEMGALQTSSRGGSLSWSSFLVGKTRPTGSS